MKPNKDDLIDFRGGWPQGTFVPLSKQSLTWGLSPVAVLAYGLLMNRAELSFRNGWLDERDLPFVIYPLDDLGAERDTDFALEVLESFVDARCLVSRPLLVTTNLSGKQLRNPADLRYARLFDRVLALCPYPVLLTGASRRVKQEEARRNRLRELLDSPEEQPG